MKFKVPVQSCKTGSLEILGVIIFYNLQCDLDLNNKRQIRLRKPSFTSSRVIALAGKQLTQ